MQRSVVIVTGTDHGIGYYLTAELLKSDYFVAGLDLSGDNLQKLLERPFYGHRSACG